jgi:D-glycero-alpha-D-manno-heptose 1-phosphate guanylyltransferase
MHAIILAGGFGTRLRSVVADVPKPLADVAGRPFLVWLIEALAAQGVTGVTLSVHHQWEKIREYFERFPPSLPVDYAVEKIPLGTGGAMAFALQGRTDPVLVLNGDTFVQVDYRAFYAQHCRNNATLSMVLREVPDTGRYGEVTTRGNLITGFTSGQDGKPGLINAGIYALSPLLFQNYSMPETFSFERDFVPQHVEALAPQSFIADAYFIDIGIPEDYARAQTEIPHKVAHG